MYPSVHGNIYLHQAKMENARSKYDVADQRISSQLAGYELEEKSLAAEMKAYAAIGDVKSRKELAKDLVRVRHRIKGLHIAKMAENHFMTRSVSVSEG